MENNEAWEIVNDFYYSITNDGSTQGTELAWEDAKKCSKIYIDSLIIELRKRVPCGNPNMNDLRIEELNEIRKQIVNL